MGGRALLAWPMGCGKTLASLLHIQRHPQNRPVVVVCPAGLKFQWRKEAKKHIGMHADVLEGLNPSKSLPPREPKLVIVNYDILSVSKHGSGWLDWLKALNPQLVILDECHFLGDMRSKRTKAVRKLCQDVPQVIALSGTPLTNRPKELFPVLNILRPDLFPSWWQYGHRWCGARRTPWGWNFDGATRLPELHTLLEKEVMIRRRKEDVLDQLPAKRRHVVTLPLSDRREYDLAHDDFIKWLHKHRPDKVGSAAKAEALVRGGYLKRLAGKLKLPSVIDWVNGFLEEDEGKLILFAHHVEVVEQLHARWARESVMVNGSVSMKKRRMAEDEFLKSNKKRIFVGNMRAAGTGWSAKGVSTVAFAEMDWTPGAHQQAGDRTHGIGRGVEGETSEEWWLVAKGTIEEKLVKLLQKKSRILDSVLDGKPSKDFDVFDKLMASMLKGSNNGKV